MILEIEKGEKNTILRTPSLKIEKIDEEIQKLIGDMLETMTKNNGLGLAACQVGKNLKLFVISKELSDKQIFINPEITKISQDQEVMEEGCLSLPGISKRVKRPRSLKISALDEKGRKFKIRAEGLLARAIQHEFDHLRGVLIVDKE